MKYAISQIRKFIKPYHFEYDIEQDKLVSIRQDVIRFDKCHITGTLEEPRQEHYVVTLCINADLIMQCAVSLEEVPYHLEFSEKVIFGYEEDDDYLIQGETLDIDEAVRTETILNLPYRVVKEGYEDLFEKDM
jgi:uncharacterized metal-binding protein YceD (DUF177 family)